MKLNSNAVIGLIVSSVFLLALCFYFVVIEKPENLIVKEPEEPEKYSSMWVGPNFVDTEYSALLRPIELTKLDVDFQFGVFPHRIKVKVLDVYKGDLSVDDELDVIIYLTILSDESRIEEDFILSFCKSEKETYYMHRDFLILKDSEENKSEFTTIKEEGTEYEGAGDCSVTNYPNYNPDTYLGIVYPTLEDLFDERTIKVAILNSKSGHGLHDCRSLYEKRYPNLSYGDNPYLVARDKWKKRNQKTLDKINDTFNNTEHSYKAMFSVSGLYGPFRKKLASKSMQERMAACNEVIEELKKGGLKSNGASSDIG